MANDPTIFVFAEREVRTVTVAGENVWLAKDVAESLGYSWNGTSRVKHVPEEWRGVTSVVTPSGEQEMTFLTEAGLFFFLNRSDKPAALPFQKWVAGEVLPAIRKNGGYMVAAPDETPELVMARAILLAQDTIKRQNAQIEAAKPIIEAHARIAGADGSLNVTEAAKSLQMKPANLFSWLSCNGWIYKRPGSANWLGYQSRTNAGDVTHKVTTVLRADGSEKITEQVRITPQGLDKLARLIPGRPMLAA